MFSVFIYVIFQEVWCHEELLPYHFSVRASFGIYQQSKSPYPVSNKTSCTERPGWCYERLTKAIIFTFGEANAYRHLLMFLWLGFIPQVPGSVYRKVLCD